MQSKATSVEQYLAELPADRRESINVIRKLILANIDRKKIQEGMQYGMIGYYIPHSVYPNGYHCDPRQPLPYICLASQKNHLSLYMMCIYGELGDATAFQAAWKKTGKKLDMGKSCIRFRNAEDLALDVIAQAIRSTPIDAYIARYESVLNEPKEVRAARREKALAKKKAAKPKAGEKKKAATANRAKK